MISRFERREPSRSLARFYRLEVAPTLFGEWSLRRIWGRIGTEGRARLETYPTRADALDAAARIERLRHRRGYVRRPGPAGGAE